MQRSELLHRRGGWDELYGPSVSYAPPSIFSFAGLCDSMNSLG